MLEINNKYYTYNFSKDNVPILKCKNGDTIKFYTNDCYTGQITSEDTIHDDLDTSSCNPATGPLYVENALAGDVLKVTIIDIEVASKGVVVNYVSCGTELKDNKPKTRIFEIKNNKICLNEIDIEIKPMIGVIGTAPKDGKIPTGHVFHNGGNMDSRLNKKGAIIYLPVEVEGAYLGVGDLHAVMGDGEMVGTGLEVAGAVTLKVEVLKNKNINWPITEVEDYYFINVCGKTCDEAIANGYKELHRLLVDNYKMDSADAAMYISLQARLEANQACLSPEGGGNSFRIGVPKLDNKNLF